MLARGVLELHLFAQPVARARNRIEQRMPAGAQKLQDAFDLMRIFGYAHYLLAGAQAHPHLAIHAARMFRGWGQVVLAAPHLEEIEELRFELLRRGARTE